MKLLVLDNYDSFTYNLVHQLEKLGVDNMDVVRNDKIALEQIDQYDKILLSPGPGIPEEAGILKELVKHYAESKSILGVCLGHQAIVEVFGGKLINLETVFHGVATKVKVENSDGLFDGLPTEFLVGRYHSWIAERNTIPSELEITALDEEGTVMAISHKTLNIKGVQFHPESILTQHGEALLHNWLKT